MKTSRLRATACQSYVGEILVKYVETKFPPIQMEGNFSSSASFECNCAKWHLSVWLRQLDATNQCQRYVAQAGQLPFWIMCTAESTCHFCNWRLQHLSSEDIYSIYIYVSLVSTNSFLSMCAQYQIRIHHLIKCEFLILDFFSPGWES